MLWGDPLRVFIPRGGSADHFTTLRSLDALESHECEGFIVGGDLLEKVTHGVGGAESSQTIHGGDEDWRSFLTGVLCNGLDQASGGRRVLGIFEYLQDAASSLGGRAAVAADKGEEGAAVCCAGEGGVGGALDPGVIRLQKCIEVSGCVLRSDGCLKPPTESDGLRSWGKGGKLGKGLGCGDGVWGGGGRRGRLGGIVDGAG